MKTDKLVLLNSTRQHRKQSFISSIIFYLVLSSIIVWCKGYNYTTFKDNIERPMCGRFSSCLQRLLDLAGWRNSRFFVVYNTTWNRNHDVFEQDLEYFAWMVSDGNQVTLSGQVNLIIFTANFQTLRNIISDMNINRLDAAAEIIVSLSDVYTDIEHVKKSSHGIPDLLWNANRPSAVFFTRTARDVLITSYRAFEDNCKPSPLKLITTCYCGVFQVNNIQIFPKKMANAFNCSMNITWLMKDSYTVSFMSRTYKSSNSATVLASKRLVKMMAEDINLRINVIESDHIQSLHEGCREIACVTVTGFIPTPDRLETMDYLPGYQSNALVVIYHEKLIRQHYWRNIFLPFETEVWIAILLIFVMSGGNTIMAKFCLKRKSIIPVSNVSFFAFLKALFADGRLISTSTVSRIFFFLWSVYAFYITSAYSCGLYGYLTTAEELDSYKTFKDLDRSGLLIGGTRRSREFLYDPEDSSLMDLHNKYNLMSRDEVHRFLLNGTTAGIMLRNSVQAHNLLTSGIPNKPYRIVSENILSFVSPIYVSKGSPIITVIRPRIMDLHTYGFSSYWQRYYTHLMSIRNKTQAIQDELPITLPHFYSLFCIFIFGMLLGTVSFGLELYYQRTAIQKAANVIHNIEIIEKNLVKELKKDIKIVHDKSKALTHSITHHDKKMYNNGHRFHLNGIEIHK